MRFAQLAGATIVPAPPSAIRLRYEQSRRDHSSKDGFVIGLTVPGD